jgi:hypothetical protein
MSKLKLGVAAGVALAVSSPAAAVTNLVTNGSFETGDFTGWDVVGGSGGTDTAPVVIPYNSNAGYDGGAFGEPIPPSDIVGGSPDAAGNYTAYFSSDTANPHSLTQLVNLVAGWTYDIGFDYYAPANGISNPNDATLQFLVNGVQVGSTLTAGSASGTPGQTWFNFNTQFVAGASGAQPYTFEFRGLGVTAADFAVDRVYATAAVPEPAVWALMIFGFGAIGGVLRTSRRRPAILPA